MRSQSRRRDAVSGEGGSAQERARGEAERRSPLAVLSCSLTVGLVARCSLLCYCCPSRVRPQLVFATDAQDDSGSIHSIWLCASLWDGDGETSVMDLAECDSRAPEQSDERSAHGSEKVGRTETQRNDEEQRERRGSDSEPLAAAAHVCAAAAASAGLSPPLAAWSG